MYDKKEVGLSEGSLVFLFAIAVNLAIQFTVSIIAMAAKGLGDSTYFNLVAMLLLQCGFLAVPIVYYCTKKKAVPVLASPITAPRPSAALGLALPILSLLGFYLPAFLFQNFLARLGYRFSPGLDLNTPGKLVFGIIVMVIAAPFCEELIFRGFLLSGLRKRFNPYVAAQFSALAFSLMHMNPEQTVYQFCLGYVCALAAIKSGNLLVPMVVHAGNNLLAILLDYTAVGVPFEKMMTVFTSSVWATVLSTIGLVLVCGAAIFFICLLMERLGGKSTALPDENPDGTKTEKGGLIGMGAFVGGLVLCAVMWIFVFVAAMIPNDIAMALSSGNLTRGVRTR